MIIRNQSTISPFLFSKRDGNKVQSGKFGLAGSGAAPATDYAQYDFTSSLVGTGTAGSTLVSDVDPTPSASGIALTASNNSKIVTSAGVGFPVNDFVITTTVTFNANISGTSVVFENEFGASNPNSFFLFQENGNIPYLRKYALGGYSTIQLPTTGNLTGRTFDYTITQDSINGMTLLMVEVGGSSYSETSTDAATRGVSNTPAWTGYVSLAERDTGAFQLNQTIKDWNIDPL